MIEILCNIYRKVFNDEVYKLMHSRKEEEDYLMSFPEPKDDFERSFFQYECQKWAQSVTLKYLFINIIAMVLILPITWWFRVRGKEVPFKRRYHSVLTRKHIEAMLPKSYNKDYIVAPSLRGSLTESDMKIVKELRKRYFFSFFFRLKCISRVASYSELIRIYNPREVLSSAEYSFTSSILTLYCESNGVKHINLMHGEMCYNIRRAFSRFSIFYVWDKHYIKMLKALRASETVYLVNPIHLPPEFHSSNEKRCIYYLGGEKKNDLKRLKTNLEKMKNDYLIRIHPVYRSNAVFSIFNPEHIEDPEEVTLFDSLANAEYVIASDSTVLFQAYKLGLCAVIDDLTQPTRYRQLVERDYIMTSKPHMLLSDLIEKR